LLKALFLALPYCDQAEARLFTELQQVASLWSVVYKSEQKWQVLNTSEKEGAKLPICFERYLNRLQRFPVFMNRTCSCLHSYGVVMQCPPHTWPSQNQPILYSCLHCKN